MRRFVHCLWIVVAALTGCAGRRALRVAPGYLDQRALVATARLRGVDRWTLHSAPDGTLEKIEVYHADDAAVPEPVRRLAEVCFPGHHLLHYEYELYGEGEPIHELEVETADQRRCEVSATATGTLRYIECPLSPVPEGVHATLARLFPGKTPNEVESRKGPTLDEVDAEFALDDGVHQVRLRPTGELIAHWRRIPATVQYSLPVP